MGYAGFACSDLTMDEKTLTAGVTVRNTGACEGTETVQFYLRDVAGSVLTPVKRLIGFAQTTLMPGAQARVTVTFPRSAFALVNRRGERVVEPGEFVLMAGHSSRDEDLLSTAFWL